MSTGSGKYSQRFAFSGNLSRAVLEAATYEPKRSMSNGRLIFSALSLIFGLFMVYCAMFYVPAFVNVDKYISVHSHNADQTQNAQEKPSFLKPYKELFRLNRGYFKAGQTLTANYVKTPDNTLTLLVKKCDALPVVEIFTCEALIVDKVIIKSYNNAKYDFQIIESGFYFIEEQATEPSPYKVIWERNRS